jgi:uncharacterized membrane protein YbhN (UPF0104 family)
VSEQAPRVRLLRRFAGVVGNVLAAVGVVFVVHAVVTRVDTLPALHPTPALAAAFVAGVLVQLAAVVLATSSWRALLRGAGVDHPWRDCFRAIGGSAVAKYVPGNVFHLVGRAAVASDDGVAAGVVVGTMALEAVLVLVSAGVVGGPALVTRLDELRALVPARGLFVLAVIAIVAVVAVVVGAFGVRGVLRRRQARTSPGALATALLLDVVTFVLLGGAMAGTLAAVLATNGDAAAIDARALVVACVPAFAVAWALGFVVPGAPGGVGVREAAFVLLLPLPGDVVRAAVVVALVLGRLQSVAADVLVFVVARALPRRPSSSSTSSS